MAKYRKRPVVVEAVRWPFDEFPADWPKGVVISNQCQADPTDTTGRIETLEGVMTVDRGDYIIKGVHDEFYPCKPEIFAKTYELVEELTLEVLTKIVSELRTRDLTEDTAGVADNPICLHMNTSTEYEAQKTTCLDCGKEAPL